jgi:hypothetical protein
MFTFSLDKIQDYVMTNYSRYPDNKIQNTTRLPIKRMGLNQQFEHINSSWFGSVSLYTLDSIFQSDTCKLENASRRAMSSPRDHWYFRYAALT